MRRLARLGLAVSVLLGSLLAPRPPARAASQAAGLAEPASPSALFIENRGQFPAEALYQVRGASGAAWVVRDGLWLSLLQPRAQDARRGSRRALVPTSDRQAGVNLKLSFVGANPRAVVQPFSPTAARFSYLLGNRPAGWVADAAAWGGLVYTDLYPGIDLILTAAPAGGLDWRLQTRSGADLRKVRLRVQGAESIAAKTYRLVLATALGEIDLPLPSLPAGAAAGAARTTPEVRRFGARTFLVEQPFGPTVEGVDARAGPELDAPAATTGMLFSTYLGGSNWDSGYGITVDASGAIYVTGETPSNDLPVSDGAFDRSVALVDAFVAKLNPAGSSLVYATFLGGSNLETGWDIAVENGIAYVAGETWSTDFPLAAGNAGENDVFVAALNAAGTGLVFAARLGGSDQEAGNAIAVEGGNSYVAGMSWSRDFPGITYQRNGDAFVVKLGPAGARLYTATLAGSDTDSGLGISVSGGNAFVAGETWSSDFPATGYAGQSDAFVVKLNSVGTRVYAKLLGGAGEDRAEAIQVDGSGNAFVAGTTRSADFPVTEGSYGGSYDAMFCKLDAGGSRVYSAYLGGSGWDEGLGLGLDGLNGVYVAGRTNSTNFPTTSGALQPVPAGSNDAFLTRYDLAGNATGHRTYSSYFGGSASDAANDLDVDNPGNSYLVGQTLSTNLPTTDGALDRSLGGTEDAFVAKFLVGPVPQITLKKYTNGADADLPPGPSIPVGSTVVWTFEVANTGELALTNVIVADNPLGAIACPKISLAAGESMTCTRSGTATAGQHTSTATGTATATTNTPTSTATATATLQWLTYLPLVLR